MKLEQEIKQTKFKNEYEKLVINIIFTASWLTAKHTRLLKPYGITPQQFNILRILRGQHPQPVTVNLLIDRMLDKSSNASRLVEKLRVKGLVERRTCVHDRRAVDVLITEKGMHLLDELDTVASGWLEEFEVLAPKEAKRLNFLLDKLRG